MVTTSKSMHRVQIKLSLRHEMSGLCEKTKSIYIVFTSCNHRKEPEMISCMVEKKKINVIC